MKPRSHGKGQRNDPAPQHSLDSTQLSSHSSLPSLSNVSCSTARMDSLDVTQLPSASEVDGNGNTELDISLSEVDLDGPNFTRHVVDVPPRFPTISEVMYVQKADQDVESQKHNARAPEMVKSAVKMVRFATPIAVVKSHTSLSSFGSEDHRACRICQSETGPMVRPCACAGTMGDIHESCLNQWLQTSNRGNTCEICKEEYAKSGNVIRPIWKWTKPNFKSKHIFEIVTLLLLLYSFYYTAVLAVERKFTTRINTNAPLRSYDAGRICSILMIIGGLVFAIIYSTVKRFLHYIRKQRTMHFIDSEKQDVRREEGGELAVNPC